jgi:hypothetical protein
MVDKLIYQNEDERTRLVSLQNTADTVVKNKSYYKRLSAEEVALKRKDFTDKSLKISDLEEDKKELVSQFKEQIDPLKTDIKILGTEVRNGFTRFEGNLYGFIDEESRMVHFYSENGELIETETRPANQEELGLFSGMRIVKSGTHN